MMIEKQLDMPVLTPLLACYNVPAPIITFLIKKPDCDQKMEIISPMDIDPCVVSEHAGINLSHPLPMVSTASNSPAHFKTTTQPTVKDFKNTQMVLVVPSTSNSTAHSEVSTQPNDVVATRIQTESTPSLLVSSEPKQETESPIANVTLDQNPGNKKNQDPLQKEALAVVDSLFVCSIPDPGCDYQKIVTVDQMTTPMCMDPTSMTKTNVNQLLCNICKISCSSEKCFERHVLGKQHLKAVKLLEKIEAFHVSQTSMDMTPIEMPLEDLKPIKCQSVNMDEDNKPTRCEVCEVSCTSTKDFKRHSSGKKHIKKLQKLGKVPELPSTSSPGVNPKEGNLTKSELCGIFCTSGEELTKHLLGQKHKKSVRNSQTLKKHSLAPAAAKTSLKDLMYEDMEEGEIVAEDGSKRKANGSLASDDNVHTKRQKVAEKVMDSGELLTCKLCNVASNGFMAYQDHLLSSEHSAIVMKQIDGRSSKRQVFR